MNWSDEIVINSDEYVPSEYGTLADKARNKALTLDHRKRFKFLKKAIFYGVLSVEDSLELMKDGVHNIQDNV